MIRSTLFALSLLLAAPGVAGDADADTPEVPRAASSDFAADLDPILDVSAMRRPAFGVQVVDVGTGEEVFSRAADRTFVPASTMKLITSAAALDALGPSYAFTTDVYVDGEVEDGVLDGDLILRGTGDPTFTAEKLWRLLRDLRVDGIERVQGDLVLDATRFPGDTMIPGWGKKVDIEDGPSYFPQIGALQLEFGAAVIVVRPGGEAGKPAKVYLETPAGAYVELDSEVVTGSSRGRTRLDVERSVSRDKVTFELEGSIAEGHEAVRIRRAVPDPTRFFRAVTLEMLRSVGPRVEGSVTLGELPDDAERVRRVYSPPLASILMDTNKYSSNFMAESVLRALGAEERGEGTWEAGLDVVREYLRGIGVPDSDFVVKNGSGLSRETRMTPAVLTAVLLDMAADPQVGAEFAGSMSICGRDGTLSRRLKDNPGQMRGKTGTLNGVHTLAGFVDADDGTRYAYAFLINNVPGSLWPVKGVQDDFLTKLMTLSRR
jgi:D-alanyl-D-alanine carboxypeptidase/D-alanyl-D-alanine-endopeptidase (penicillin-binding protein 4)